jgi:hypothetical protein
LEDGMTDRAYLSICTLVADGKQGHSIFLEGSNMQIARKMDRTGNPNKKTETNK